MARRMLKSRSRGSASVRLLSWPKGIGLFKLATGLVVLASVLFLVPGLRLLVPGLQDIGTTKTHAMPARTPSETVTPAAPETSPRPDEAKQDRVVGLWDNESAFIGALGDQQSTGIVPALMPTQSCSAVADVSGELLGVSVSQDVLGPAGAYEQTKLIGSGPDLSPGLAQGFPR